VDDFYINNEISTSDEKLNEYILLLKDCFNDNNKNFAKLCCTIHGMYEYAKNLLYKVLKNNEYYGFLNIYELLAQFGFSQKSVSRYINCYKKYIIATSPNDASVSPMFEKFSPSKLYAMLPLSYAMIETAIKKQCILPNMTCKEIDKKVKSLAGKDNIDNLVSEDSEKLEEKTPIEEQNLPEAFDPKKTHTFEYFNAFSKKELINCLFACEDLIKKLLKKKEK